MASAWVIIGLTVTAVAFVCSIVSYTIPFWLNESNSHLGLWAKCRGTTFERDWDCDWYWDDNFKEAKSKPIWWQASMGLMGVGVLLLFITFLIGLTALCCCKSAVKSGYYISLFLMLACMLHIATAATFYGFGHERRAILREVLGHSYWLCVSTACLCFVAFFLYLMDACRHQYRALSTKEIV